MSFWSRLSDILSRVPLVGQVSGLFETVAEAIRSSLSGAERAQVTFTIAMIALSAKMAKADGVVTDDEVDVVKRLFIVPEAEKRNVARLFNMAKQDLAGFEEYAAQIAKLHIDQPEGLVDIMDGLFTIARADGIVHERELAFLGRVAEIFGLSPREFERITFRHVKAKKSDPYVILGVERGMSLAEIRKAWRQQVSDNHPDRLMARGMPEDCIKLANDRVASLNAAYDTIEKELRLQPATG